MTTMGILWLRRVGCIASHLGLPLGDRLLCSPVPRLQSFSDLSLDFLAPSRKGGGGECRGYVAAHVVGRQT